VLTLSYFFPFYTMPKRPLHCISLLLLATCSHAQLRNSDTHVSCHIVQADELMELGDAAPAEEQGPLTCWTDDHEEAGLRRPYPLELPAAVHEEHQALIQTGQLHLPVPLEHLRAGRLPDSWRPPPSRHLQQQDKSLQALRTGTQTLLAVRIVTPDAQPDETLNDIYDSLWGPPPTLPSQFAEISHGSLNFVPYQEGVLEIALDASIANRSMQGDVMQEILATTTAQLEGTPDHVLFCLPTGALLKGGDAWKAFTYLREPYSYYQRGRCTKLSVVMHEMGHSLGFRHSGFDRDDYGDEQGYMGYAVNQMRVPIKSFNAVKHYHAGWLKTLYQSAADLVQRHEWTAKVPSFVDVSDAPSILHFGPDLYLQYNRAKGYNAQSRQANLLTLNLANGEDDVSDLVGALDIGDSYLYTNLGMNRNLVVHLCDKTVEDGVDYAVVAFRMDYGVHIPSCQAPLTDWSSVVPSEEEVVKPPTMHPTFDEGDWGAFTEEPPQEEDATPEKQQPKPQPAEPQTPEEPPTTPEDLPMPSTPQEETQPDVPPLDTQQDVSDPEAPPDNPEEPPTTPEEPLEQPKAPEGDQDEATPEGPSPPDQSDPVPPPVAAPIAPPVEKDVALEAPSDTFNPIVMVLVAAFLAALLAGLVAYRCCGRSSEYDTPMQDDSMRLGKKQHTHLDRTESEDFSDRSQEDGVIEVRMISAEDYISDVVW